MKMNFYVGISILMLSCPAFAAKKSCDELKNEIQVKLNSKGVKNYILEIVVAGKDSAEKIVGSCDGGMKKISYKKK